VIIAATTFIMWCGRGWRIGSPSGLAVESNGVGRIACQTVGRGHNNFPARAADRNREWHSLYTTARHHWVRSTSRGRARNAPLSSMKARRYWRVYQLLESPHPVKATASQYCSGSLNDDVLRALIPCESLSKSAFRNGHLSRALVKLE
jgi:hypothetical protein